MAAKLKKGDRVVVIAGRDAGRTGEILSVDPGKGRAVVDDVNVAIRHVKQSPNERQAGRMPSPMPVSLSNLALVDPATGGPTRVGFRFENGKKVRFAKKSGVLIDG